MKSFSWKSKCVLGVLTIISEVRYQKEKRRKGEKKNKKRREKKGKEKEKENFYSLTVSSSSYFSVFCY